MVALGERMTDKIKDDEGVGPTTLDDSDITTERKVGRRSFLAGTGVVAGATTTATGLISTGARAGDPYGEGSDTDPSDPFGGGSDTDPNDPYGEGSDYD